ncbi:MAG: 23S rRNA (pseudouridine(1915)-N(3))-methyltransferase RlmH [Ferruginibacter sp.]|nr:23S rRNA (pseudouridine(1915)-N(3))-methyltransferase RlmH [Ferruginibacter sp.]
MKIQCWSIGKAHESFVQEGIELFSRRIMHYYPIQWRLFTPPKNAGILQDMALKKKEATAVLEALDANDYLVLLDENGKMLTSEALAGLLQQRANEAFKNIVFLIGGAYGVDESVKQRANLQWSLSTLVFPHQLVRLILSEQIYRACTILRNEKYHHA